MQTNKSENKNQKSPEILWKQFQKGDMASFRKIYESHYQILFNFGLNYLSESEVEDCIQNLFLYILQHRKSTTKVKNVKAYLITSFRNSVLKFLKEKEHNLQLIEGITGTGKHITSKESITTNIEKLLKKLTPRESEIIHLKYYQNYKNIEIAELLNIKYQTVRNILHNAFVKIKKTSIQYFPH